MRSMAHSFLSDLERAWATHGSGIIDVMVTKHPERFFTGMVALSRSIAWDTSDVGGSFDRTLTPDQIMDQLEQRVGPEGRKLFEKFIRQVNVLQAKQLSAREEEEEE